MSRAWRTLQLSVCALIFPKTGRHPDQRLWRRVEQLWEKALPAEANWHFRYWYGAHWGVTCMICAATFTRGNSRTDNEDRRHGPYPGDLSICDECVSLMVGIIAADHPDWRSAQIEKLQRLATPARG